LSVPVEAIEPNPHQPRSTMDAEKLEELANSIREHGLIQPLVVNKAGEDKYTLIAGERRWQAARIAGLEEVPVLVKEVSPQDMLELALVENIQRDDLNPLEEAVAYQQLIDDFGLTQEEVAEKVGKSRPTVANMVRLLRLPDDVKAAVAEGKISGRHARALLPLPSAEAQVAVMNSIIKRRVSVKQVEAIVKKMLDGEAPRGKVSESLPPELSALQSRFRESLGTKVEIRQGASGGRVVIHFENDEDLQAIYEAIVGED
jgi:ParB family chromosome partitioning protein